MSLLRSGGVRAALLAAAVPWLIAADGPARLEDFLAGLRTFGASFEQVRLDERGVRVEEASGRVLLHRPDRFRWEYAAPYEQIIVADGERVWVYEVDLAQVTVRPLDQAIAGTPAMLLSSERPVTEDFAIVGAGTAHGLEWVRLEPRDPEAGFAEVRLGFGPATLREMDLRDRLGNRTRVRFHDVERNPALDPEAFRFTPPPGTDVIEAGGG